MNCSEALLEAVAKYAFEIGLKPLQNRWLVNFEMGGRPRRQSLFLVHLLLLAELVFVVEQLQAVQNVLHCDQRIREVLKETTK